MQDEDKLLEKRALELARLANDGGYYTFSPFLTLAQQSVVSRLEGRLETPLLWLGGYPGAERRLACFGWEDAWGYGPQSPIRTLHIRAKNPRFSRELGHRDYLGSLMNLGLDRSRLGDLLVGDRECWLFCLEETAAFLCQELTQVGSTPVICAPGEAPETLVQEPEPRQITAASARADALAAGVWGLSRSESQGYFSKGLVLIDGRECPDPGRTLKAGELLSLRGKGRFRYEGEAGQTRSGRLRAWVRVW